MVSGFRLIIVVVPDREDIEGSVAWGRVADASNATGTDETSDAPPSVAPSLRRRESVKLVWNTKPKKAPSSRDLEFQPAEVVYPNRAPAGGQELLLPRTPLGEVDDTKMNRLVWGDNLLAMQALLGQGYAGKIQLIYIDPPFLSSSDYSHQMHVEGAGDVLKAPSIIERLAYRDTWSDGPDSYLDMLYPRLHLMRDLLADTGLIFVHMDWHIGHDVRVLLDEVFGPQNFVNEIAWHYSGYKRKTAKNFPRKHDVIYVYSKSADHKWNVQFKRHKPEYLARFKTDKDGRLYRDDVNPTAGGARVIYLDQVEGDIVDSVWDDIPVVNSQAKEDTGFDTQKPEALLERVIKAGSDPGDLVADFFVGSGTTAVVAELERRRWICTDLGKVGIQLTRARLVAHDSHPFVLENIGNYQRELIYREGGNIGLMQRIVMRLYGAKPHPSHADLGVVEEKGVRKLVYVGYPDRPLTARKTAELVKVARSLDGEGYDKLILLAWDYEYNYDQNLEERRRGFGVDVDPRLIPASIYEYLRKSKNEDDLQEKFAAKIQFGSKPYLKLGPVDSKPFNDEEHKVSVAIERYVLAEIPVDNEKDRAELQAISMGDKFPILIDYWAVDWDYDGKTFRSRWQDFRGVGKDTKTVGTRSSTNLRLGKKYDVAVRVVDVFGNDATATTSIDLR